MWTLKSWEDKMPAYIQMLKALLSCSQQLEDVELHCHLLGFGFHGDVISVIADQLYALLLILIASDVNL